MQTGSPSNPMNSTSGSAAADAVRKAPLPQPTSRRTSRKGVLPMGAQASAQRPTRRAGSSSMASA